MNCSRTTYTGRIVYIKYVNGGYVMSKFVNTIASKI